MPRGGLYATQRELLEALRRHLAEPGPSRFSDETLYGFLDEAAHEVAEDTGCVRNDIPVSYPANAPRVNIQSQAFDVVQFLACFWAPADSPAQRHELKIVSNEHFLRFRPFPGERGLPKYMTLVESYNAPPEDYEINKYIELWPIPDVDGIVELYVTILSWLVPAAERDNQVIPIRRAWRDLVIHKALVFCYENLGRPDLRQLKEQEYEKMLSGVRLKLLDFTTSSYGEMFDGHCFGYV